MPKLPIYFMAIALGVFLAIGLLFLTGKLSFSPDSSVYKLLGIRKPEVIGFMPYYLLDRADKPYEKYVTDLTYFGLSVDSDGSLVMLASPQEEEPGWTNLKSDNVQSRFKKARQNGLQASLLVFNADEASIAALLKEPEKHAQNLVNDTVPLIEKYGFNDLNLDIESFKPASQSAQLAYTDFVREVKKGLAEKSSASLTIDVTAISLVEPRMTNVRALAEIADRIVLMAYDYNYLYSYVSGPVAPVGGVPKQRELDVRTSLQEMLKIVPREKIFLGIPLYGYQWETISGQPGSATIPYGGATASNRRIEESLPDDENCFQNYDETAQEPYIICQRGDYYEQIFYENEQSVREKIKLAEDLKLGGVALWALGYEGEEIIKPIADYKKSFYLDPPLLGVN